MHKHICQLRIDLETLILAGPNQTSECLEDTFSISGDSVHKPLVICGVNSGQHSMFTWDTIQYNETNSLKCAVYMDLPEGASSARINIATASQGLERSWKIKVSQIACNSPYRGMIDVNIQSWNLKTHNWIYSSP